MSALSVAGEGDRSSAVPISTSPAAVSGQSSVAQTTSSISRSWDAVVVSGGEEVTGYIVHRSHGAEGADHSTVDYNGTGSTEATATVVELEGGRLYAFVVSGVSAAGEGNVSAEAATQSTSPGARSGQRLWFRLVGP